MMPLTPPSALRALLVEDNKLIQLAHQTFLQELGYKVTVAQTGIEAVLLAAQHFDVILMDVGLPELNGIDATARIREQEKTHQHRALIIGVTGYSDTQTLEACFTSGMDDVLIKPLGEEKLKERLGSFFLGVLEDA